MRALAITMLIDCCRLLGNTRRFDQVQGVVRQRHTRQVPQSATGAGGQLGRHWRCPLHTRPFARQVGQHRRTSARRQGDHVVDGGRRQLAAHARGEQPGGRRRWRREHLDKEQRRHRLGHGARHQGDCRAQRAACRVLAGRGRRV